MKTCPHCQQRVPNDETICSLCNQVIERICPLCKTTNEHTATRCSNCGYMFPNETTPPTDQARQFREVKGRERESGTTMKTIIGRSIFWALVLGVIGGAAYLVFVKGDLRIGKHDSENNHPNKLRKAGSITHEKNAVRTSPVTPINVQNLHIKTPKVGITPYQPGYTPKEHKTTKPRRKFVKQKLVLSNTTQELLNNRINFLFCAKNSNVTKPVHFQFMISQYGRAKSINIKTTPHQASFCFKHELKKMRFKHNRSHWIDLKLPIR